MAGKKELIMASAVSLLEQHNYKEISVLDIVADSKVNRNTFYYHFKDMPALIEELVRRCIERVFDDNTLSLEEKLRRLVLALYENRKRVMHVHRYVDMAVFNEGLERSCAYLMERVFDCSSLIQNYSEEKKNCIFAMGKSCAFGLCSAWFMNDVSEEGMGIIYSVIESTANRL